MCMNMTWQMVRICTYNLPQIGENANTFVAIVNALDISADALLLDVVTYSVTGVTNELSEMIEKLSKNEQKRIFNLQ